MLCEICQGCLKNPKSMALGLFYGSGTHHSGWLSLKNSAQSDCSICVKVLEEVSNKGLLDTSGHEIMWDMSYHHFGAEIGHMDIHVDSVGPTMIDKFEINFALLPNSVMQQYSKHLPIEPSTSTGSISSLNIALEWFLNCTQNHGECSLQASQHTAWYPTRLIDIGSSDHSVARLIVTNEMSPLCGEKYTTLSHCWGGLDMVKLTVDSLANFKAVLPVHEFPKTFRDAINVTRYLNIRYLWIDSVCIIQEGDNLEDWSREASLMQNVYGNSTCNISALAAKDGTKGLFYERSLTQLLPQSAKLQPSTWRKISRKLTLRKPLITEFHVIENGWEKYVEQSPLNRRAWYIQERILAPRVLHFGQRELFWECHRLTASETFKKGLSQHMRADNMKTMHPNLTTNVHTRQLQYEEMITTWSGILHTYCRSSLTRAEDKLVAISGIAKHFQILLGNDQYIAGLWRGCLATQLLWYCLSHATSRVHPYRAPSFSWASLDAPILVPTYWKHEHELLRVLDVSITTLTDDTTGQVTGGYLRLQGYLKKLELSKKISKWKDRVGLRFDTVEVIPSMNLYYIWVVKSQAVFREGLILKPTTSPDFCGVYERVGHIVCWSEIPLEVPQENEAQIPCESYDKDLKHTFIIV